MWIWVLENPPHSIRCFSWNLQQQKHFQISFFMQISFASVYLLPAPDVAVDFCHICVFFLTLLLHKQPYNIYYSKLLIRILRDSHILYPSLHTCYSRLKLFVPARRWIRLVGVWRAMWMGSFIPIDTIGFKFNVIEDMLPNVKVVSVTR